MLVHLTIHELDGYFGYLQRETVRLTVLTEDRNRLYQSLLFRVEDLYVLQPALMVVMDLFRIHGTDDG